MPEPARLLAIVVLSVVVMAAWAELACTVAVFRGVAALGECRQMDLRGLMLDTLAAVLVIAGYRGRE